MKTIHCPSCGHIYAAIPTASRLHRQPHSRYQRRRYHAGAGQAAEEADVSVFRAPARAAGIQEDVATPIWQAGITGFLLGGVSIWPTAWYGWPLFVPFAVASTTWAGVWLILLADHRRQLWSEERYERETSPPPDDTPPPQQERRSIRLDVEEDANHLRYAHLPLSFDQLQDAGRLILSGRSFSVANMTGRGAPLSRSEFEELRQWLLSNGYARWADPANRQQGIEFGAKGMAFWKALAGKNRRA